MTAATHRRVAESRTTHTAPAQPGPERPARADETSAAPGANGWAPRVAAAIGPRAPRLLARYSAVLGFLLIIDVLIPHHRHGSGVSHLLPAPASATAEALVMVSGWALLRLARGLGRAKRTEANLATAVCVVVILADVVRSSRHIVEAVIAAVMLAGLVAFRKQFTATADPRGRSYALKVASQLLSVAFAVGIGLLYLPGHVPSSVSFADRLREVALSIAGFGGWIPLHGERYADLVHATLVLFGVVTAVVTLLFWLRPVQPVSALSAEDEQRLAALLAVHGSRDSLGYFALRRDKSVVWSASGKAAITYRVVNGVALVSGDPLGDPEAWPGAIAAFRELVQQYGWTPAVMGCSELGATVFRRDYGLSAIELGDEAIVHTGEFSLQGRAMRGVRQATNRVERAGYSTQVRRIQDLGPAEVDELVAAAAAWRGDDVERGFSMALSRLGDASDPDCVVVTARRDGQLAGLLHFVPWSADGLSLDLMRRDRAADNGLNEFMITELMQACPQLGVTRVSLNFAVFRDALERGGRIGAGPVLRLWRGLLMIASRWYQIDSLYRFNDKFNPHWEPRYFSYSRVRDIPRIALAALEAEAFVVRPKLLERVLGR